MKKNKEISQIGQDTAQKMKFPLRISSVNVTKSAGLPADLPHLLKKSLMANFFVHQWDQNTLIRAFTYLLRRFNYWKGD